MALVSWNDIILALEVDTKNLIKTKAEVNFNQYSKWIKECLNEDISFKSKEHEIRYWKLYGRMTELADILGKEWIP
jgi:hypothetical protein